MNIKASLQMMFGVCVALILLPLQVKAEPATEAETECSCKEVPSVAAAFAASEIVIVGQADQVGVSSLKKDFLEVRLRISRVYKGFDGRPVQPEQVAVYTPIGESKCGYSFLRGMDYLVYATGNPAFYQTTRCNRTTMLESAMMRRNVEEENAASSGESSPQTTTEIIEIEKLLE